MVALRVTPDTLLDGIPGVVWSSYITLVGTLGKDPHIKLGHVSAISNNEVTYLIKEPSTSGPVGPFEREPTP